MRVFEYVTLVSLKASAGLVDSCLFENEYQRFWDGVFFLLNFWYFTLLLIFRLVLKEKCAWAEVIFFSCSTSSLHLDKLGSNNIATLISSFQYIQLLGFLLLGLCLHFCQCFAGSRLILVDEKVCPDSVFAELTIRFDKCPWLFFGTSLVLWVFDSKNGRHSSRAKTFLYTCGSLGPLSFYLVHQSGPQCTHIDLKLHVCHL